MENSKTYRVLVVDDELEIRELTRRAIVRSGFKCEVAEDGQDAWNWAQTGEFDAVVTDLRMPNRNGHSLCVDLLKLEPRPVVIVLTGVSEPKIEKDLRARGVDDFQYKPVSFTQLAATVTKHIERRHALTALWNDTKDCQQDDPKDELSGVEHDLDVWSAMETPATERHLACVMLSDPEKSREIASLLNSKNVEARTIGGMDELYHVLQTRVVDLFVLENDLPGILTGLDVVEKSREIFHNPEVILLSDFSSLDRDATSRANVQYVLRQDDSVESIVNVAKSVLRSFKPKDQLIPQRARNLVQLLSDAPPLPKLMKKLFSYLLMDVDDVSIPELTRDVAMDFRASAELLRLTNNGRLGSRRKVERVRDAVNLHGFRQTVTLLLSSAMLSAQHSISEIIGPAFHRWYSQRCVLIASTAFTFAQKFERVSPELAFLLGLIQDAGILLMRRSVPKRYGNIHRMVMDQKQGNADLTILEKQEFQISHADVSAALMESWGLDRRMIAPVLAHHDVACRDEHSNEVGAFVRVMRLGEFLADLSTRRDSTCVERLNTVLSDYARSDPNACHACIEHALAKASDTCQLFSIDSLDAAAIEQFSMSSRTSNRLANAVN